MECRGELKDNQKIWLYEARARKVVPDFSIARCVGWGIIPYDYMDAEGGDA